VHTRILGERYLLNHGVVRLLEFMGSDLHVVRAARVSYDAAWRAGDDDANDKRLMRRLWSGKPSTHTGPLPELPKHSTPFEACFMTFEVLAPVFVFRQWHRHRTQSYNELSARYRELPETFYLPEPHVVGFQSKDSKQGRTTTDVDPDTLEERIHQLQDVKNHCESAFELYRDLLGAGWPKELARIVLPFGTYSHMFASMNLLNFFKFANLRADSHAQYEIRVYAEAMLEMVADICPVSVGLFKEANTPAF
jgi:thymidylate synthase (FAD)